MSAYEITGTANFSQIQSAITNLQSSLNSIKAPSIAPQINTSGAGGVMGGLKGSLLSGAGDFASVGQSIGQNLTMGMTSQFGMAGNVAGSLATALGPAGIAAGLAGAAILGAGTAAVSAATQWESFGTSIGRTTGLSGENLSDMMNSLQDLRVEMGISADSARGLVEQAGSIGVGQSKLDKGDIAGYKTEILDFAKSTAMLQGAWGMSADAVSSGVGKMGSVTLGAWNKQREAMDQSEMSWSDYALKVGGQVDTLANAMGSSEEEIVTAMRNSSGAVAKYAPSEDTYGKWLAMSSFLIDTGDSAGEAGTKIERMAQKMDQNGAGIASIMGIDQTTLREKLSDDFMGTVQELGEVIAAMPADQRPDLAKLFGLEGKGLMDKVIADIEQGTGKLQKSFDLAEKGGDVKNSYKAVADDASHAFSRVGESVRVALEKAGGVILPSITPIVSGIADAFSDLTTIGSELWGPFSAAISPATAAVSLLASGIGKVTGMSLDVLVAGAKGINTAFQTGKAFVSAFAEEITKIVQESETFQTLSGYIDEAGAAFARLKEWATETFDKIVTGLSGAIPTAIKGLGGAVGTLMDKAGLGGVADAAGSLFGFGEDVYHNAAQKLGWETEEATAEGTKKGMEKGAEEAKNEVSETTGEAMRNGTKDGISSGLQDAMNDLKVFGKAVSDEAALAYINAQDDNVRHNAGVRATKLASGLDVEMQYQIDKNHKATATLWVDGQQVAGPVTGLGLANTIPELFKAANLGYDQANILDLTGNPGEAALMRLKVPIAVDLYTEAEQAAFQDQNYAIWENFGNSTATILSDNFDFIQQHGSQKAKDAIGKILDAFAHPDASKLNEVDGLFKQIANEMLDPSQAGNLTAAFTQSILPHITNMKAFCKQQGSEMGQSITGAFSDSFLSVDERALITGMEPMVDQLLKKAPEYGTEAGLLMIKSLIDAANAGASDADLNAMWNAMWKPLDKVTKEINDQTAGYNQLQKAIEDCSECAVSEFGMWQEAQTGLFQEAYIGQSGEAYISWKQGQNRQNLASQTQWKTLADDPYGTKISVSVDTTKATEELNTFSADIGKKSAEVKVGVNFTEANKKIDAWLGEINRLQPEVNVLVNIQANASQVRDIVIRTISEALA